MASLLQSEELKPERLKLDYSKYSKRQKARIQHHLSRTLKESSEGKGKEIVSEEDEGSASLTQILTKECIIHFIQAVEVRSFILIHLFHSQFLLICLL